MHIQRLFSSSYEASQITTLNLRAYPARVDIRQRPGARMLIHGQLTTLLKHDSSAKCQKLTNNQQLLSSYETSQITILNLRAYPFEVDIRQRRGACMLIHGRLRGYRKGRPRFLLVAAPTLPNVALLTHNGQRRPRGLEVRHNVLLRLQFEKNDNWFH